MYLILSGHDILFMSADIPAIGLRGKEFRIKTLIPVHIFFELYLDILQMGMKDEILDHFYDIRINEVRPTGIYHHKGIFRNRFEFLLDDGLIQE